MRITTVVILSKEDSRKTYCAKPNPHSMKLYKTGNGIILDKGDVFYRLHETDWDVVVNRDDLYDWLELQIESLIPVIFTDDLPMPEILAPIGSQEVWASGVTYFRSRTAR